MFVELVKACLAEKKYSVLEKIEYSSLWKNNMKIEWETYIYMY